MRQFFKKNKFFLAIGVGVSIFSLVVYFLTKEKIPNKQPLQFKNCENLPDLPDGSFKLVTKVIDGDTFLIEVGYSVRILGIDADEKGYFCYEPAKIALENLILNKKVRLVKDKEDFDQYSVI